MAESVDSLSGHGMSDELTDPYCDPCFKDGNVRQAAGFCPKCVEFYCQNCLGTHRRSSMTERHKILLGTEMPSCQAEKPVKYQSCYQHDGEGKDRYCFDHDTLICGICFLREHKQCSAKHVTDACSSFDISEEEKSFIYNVDLALGQIKSLNESLKSNLKSLGNMKQETFREIQAHESSIIQQIKLSYLDFIKEAERIFREQNTTLTASEQAVEQIATDIDGILKMLRKSDEIKSNTQKRFLALREFAEKIQLYKDKIRVLDLKRVDIVCTFNLNIQPLVKDNSQPGEISVQTSAFEIETEFPDIRFPYRILQPETDQPTPILRSADERYSRIPVKLTELGEIIIKTTSDTAGEITSKFASNDSGSMLLVDQEKKILQLFSASKQLLASLSVPEKPIDVAFINETEAAVSMENKKLGILELSYNSQLSMKRIIKAKHYVWRITVHNNNLIIACSTSSEKPQSVQKMDMSGNILWTVTTDSHGKKLFDKACSLTPHLTEDGKNITVTDWKNQIITTLEASSGKVVKIRDLMEYCY